MIKYILIIFYLYDIIDKEVILVILDTKLYNKEDILNIAGGNEMKLRLISNFFNTSITINGNDIITGNIDNSTKE